MSNFDLSNGSLKDLFGPSLKVYLKYQKILFKKVVEAFIIKIGFVISKKVNVKG